MLQWAAIAGLLGFCAALQSQEPNASTDASNNLCDGQIFHRYILVYTNRYAFVPRAGFDSVAAVESFAESTKNTVVRPRLYSVEEISGK